MELTNYPARRQAPMTINWIKTNSTTQEADGFPYVIRKTRAGYVVNVHHGVADTFPSIREAKAFAEGQVRIEDETPTPKRSRKATRKAVALKSVRGYELRWPHGQYDLLRATESAPKDAPKWLVRCNAHGTTTPVASAKEGDRAGTKSALGTWCGGDHEIKAS
jgi:hypothetical protein